MCVYLHFLLALGAAVAQRGLVRAVRRKRARQLRAQGGHLAGRGRVACGKRLPRGLALGLHLRMQIIFVLYCHKKASGMAEAVTPLARGLTLCLYLRMHITASLSCVCRASIVAEASTACRMSAAPSDRACTSDAHVQGCCCPTYFAIWFIHALTPMNKTRACWRKDMRKCIHCMLDILVDLCF